MEITEEKTPTNIQSPEEGTETSKKYGDVAFIDGDVSKLRLITIPQGINLYYGSQTKNSFDPTDIKLSDGTLLALFSNSPKLSSDVFMNCSNFPITNGYLHQFVTKTEIPYVQMISSSTIDKNTSLKTLDAQYCQKPDNPRLNGFAYPIKNMTMTEEVYDYIIGLCNPNQYISYVSTTICVNPYRLSDPINIF
ncbi:putative ORFan [Tupanvirus deep ocean]|uniref:ORFan n=2 Tax=Tupanvirus TaxID=2094720 RepID=A0AC62A8E9_9VIRU|nr:putative ORFan [Tupanvirus deep ocean]QKU34022.1 putative ORFan [Tupanvirus deep ocean]